MTAVARKAKVARPVRLLPWMRNRSMAEALARGECLDVRAVGEPVEGVEGVFLLHQLEDDVDYCDGTEEDWVRSIGVERAGLSMTCAFARGRHLCSGTHCHGRLFASTHDDVFLNNPNFVCVWLR